LQSDQGPFL